VRETVASRLEQGPHVQMQKRTHKCSFGDDKANKLHHFFSTISVEIASTHVLCYSSLWPNFRQVEPRSNFSRYFFISLIKTPQQFKKINKLVSEILCEPLKTIRASRMVSSAMLRRVPLVRNDVSEGLSTFFIRVTRIGVLGKRLDVTSNRRTLRRNTIFAA
jgi:hypothetical protein